VKRLELHVAESDRGERLDRFISRAGGISRGLARRTIEAGGVYLDGKRVKIASRSVWPAQLIQVILEEAGRSIAAPSTTPSTSAASAASAASSKPASPKRPLTPADSLKVLFEDEHVLVVHKPAFVAAQATLAADVGTLTAMVAKHLGLRSDREVGLVHRLDRETSGVTVFGKSDRAVAALAEAFRLGTVKKRYLAVACGPLASEGVIDAWLAKDVSKPGLFRVAREHEGVPAVTRFRSLSAPREATLVELFPQTGRTHQLRVHLLSLNAPILGDRRYGAPMELKVGEQTLKAERVLLHAESISLPHPITSVPLQVHAPEPNDLHEAALVLGVDLPRV
jgi:23S rRNA pseudouridine1911/1915/1917 synthase